MKNERLLWTLLVLGVIVVGIIAYCNKPYEFKVSRTPYKKEESPLKAYLDTTKLLTYVYKDSLFVVQYPDKFKIYRDIIRYDPSLDMFYNNGIFIRNVQYNDTLFIRLNDAAKRRIYTNYSATVKCDVNIYYTSSNGIITGRAIANVALDYLCEEEIRIDLSPGDCDYAIVEIYFDEILMYKNIVILSTDSII